MGQGHILLEGVPGLAKTLAINTLSQSVKGIFSRVQFTPDLLPADVVGTMIYNIKENDFTIKKGPVFANFVLADEINRTPPKTQSALLEAMEERQVTAAGVTHPMSQPFFVLATQNPIELEGTYPLPEAQLDRLIDRMGRQEKVLDDDRGHRNKKDSSSSGDEPVRKTATTRKQRLKARKERRKRQRESRARGGGGHWRDSLRAGVVSG
mgnify:CR=1 FL=1